MPPGVGPALVRVAVVVPVVLLVLFAGILWLLGLPRGRERRRYVTDLTRQAMEAIGALLHGPPAPTRLPPRDRIGRQSTGRGPGAGSRRRA